MLFTVHNSTLIPASRSAEGWLAGRSGTVDLLPVSKARRRSLDQNAKYWAWCAQVEREQGLEPGDAHRLHKWRWGLALLTERHPEYRERLLSMLRHLDEDQRMAAMDLVTCTSQLTVEEFQRLMDSVQRHWSGMGVILE